MEKINLFCFPFAGGSKYSYRSYQDHLPANIVLRNVEIPGRGSRANETPFTSLEQIADDIFSQIKDELYQPYAFYGHSMGGLLTYLLSQRVVANGLPKPLSLFVTGAIGPSAKYRGLIDYKLPRAEFFDQLKKLGGSPEEVLNNELLMEFFEPVLRADFEAVATYQYQQQKVMDIPISVIIGDQEKATPEEAQLWERESTSPVDVAVYSGDHFFIFQHQESIIKLIKEKLNTKVILS
ncbi:MAG: alpha/beta fold hydrolase [Bacteroidota bacterium]